MVGFVHDHIFYQKDNVIYTSSSFPNSVWKRYIGVFVNILVIGRLSSKSMDCKELGVSSGENISWGFIRSFSKARNFYLRPFKIYKELDNYLKNLDYVIIRLPSKLGIFAYIICRRRKIRYLVEVVGSWKDVNKFQPFSIEFPFVIFLNFLMKRAIKKASHVIYVTFKYLQINYPTNGKSLAISDVEYQLLDKTSFLIKRGKLSNLSLDSEISIAMIGNLSMRYKAYDVAIKAISMLLNEGLSCKLYLVGGGDSTWLKELCFKYKVSHNVIFLGSIPSGSAIFTFLDNIDFYLQISFVDSMPRALMEAMARGCLCIGTNVGDIPILLPANCIVAKGNAYSLFSKVKLFIENPEFSCDILNSSYNTISNIESCNLSELRNSFFIDFKSN